jgi:hypothetical protein
MKLPFSFHRESIVDTMIRLYGHADPRTQETARTLLERTLGMVQYPPDHPLATPGGGFVSRAMAPEHRERYAREIMAAVIAGDKATAERLYAEVKQGQVRIHGGAF